MIGACPNNFADVFITVKDVPPINWGTIPIN